MGKAAVPELMATAEQREMMYHKIREYRQTKPLFTVDFWNDGEYVGGCIAGGLTEIVEKSHAKSTDYPLLFYVGNGLLRFCPARQPI